jgi:Histone acetyltransferase
MIELESDEDLVRAFPIMRQLRPHLTEQTFIQRVRDGKIAENYRLFALENDGALVALCGVQDIVTLYYTDTLWVSELITDEGSRSKGLGGQMLEEVEEWAKRNGYRQLALSSGVQRKDAHRFYTDKMGFSLFGYEFRKSL